MSYEQYLQLTEVLEVELDKIWPSENFRNKKPMTHKTEKEVAIEKLLDVAKKETLSEKASNKNKKIKS